MRKLLFFVLFLAALGAVAYTVFFAPPSGRALLAKAIEAHGGEERLQRCVVGQFKGMGTKSGPHGMMIPIDWEETVRAPDRLKRVFKKSMGGQTSTMTYLYRDGKAWFQVDNEEPKLDTSGQSYHESMAWPLDQLLEIYRNQVELKTLEESRAANRPVFGFLVDQAGKGKLEILFDKERFLLLVIRSRVQDTEGNELKRQRIFSDYQTINGVKVPGKIQLFVDNHMTDEWMVNQVKFYEQLDERLFEKK